MGLLGIRRSLAILAHVTCVTTSAAAQALPRVELGVVACAITTSPVYLKPIAPLTTEPAAPAHLYTDVMIPAFGVEGELSVVRRVHANVQWFRSVRRTSDPPPLPLPMTPGVGWQLFIRATEQIDHAGFGAAVDLVARSRVRVSGGGGWQLEHLTVRQRDRQISSFHGSGPPATTRAFAHTFRYPVIAAGVTGYPAPHLFAFARVSVRVTRTSGESGVRRTAPITPRLGVGVSF